jgi:hypothetical protein
VPGPDVRDAVGDERPDQVAIHQCRLEALSQQAVVGVGSFFAGV